MHPDTPIEHNAVKQYRGKFFTDSLGRAHTEFGPWIAVFVLPGKNNVFQNGSDRQQSSSQGPKNAYNDIARL